MKTIFLLPFAFLFQGCEKINLPDPMRLTHVGLMEFPTTDSNYIPWDSTGGPDLYLEIYRNNVLYFKSDKSAYKDIIVYPVFFTIDTPIIVQSTVDELTYRLYDIDGQINQPMDSLVFGPWIIFKLPDSESIGRLYNHGNITWQCFYDKP